MNIYLKLFRLIVWIGILVNLTFASSSFFFPSFVVGVAGGATPNLRDPWLFNTGMLLLLNAMFYLPVAMNPLRDRLYSWLTAWGRVVASVTWIVFLATAGGFLPSGYRTFPLSDGTMGVVLLLLLRRGLRDAPAS